MFENAKRIRAKECADNAPLYFFRDLNVIYPLRKATLHIAAHGEYEVFVGKDKVGGDLLVAQSRDEHGMGFCSYDITPLVAESDFLTVRVGSGAQGSLPPTLLAQVDLAFAGGLSGCIVTDGSWLCGTDPDPTEPAVIAE